MMCLPVLALLTCLPSLAWIGGGRIGSYLATLDGNRAYAKKDYSTALKHYRAAQRQDPTGSAPHYNLGVVLYQQRKYDKAIKSFEQALASDDALLQASAFYNIGNCYFRKGDLVKAIESYKKSLQLNPNDADAKFNLELARRRLKEMAQKQQKKQKPQPQQQMQQQMRAQASQDRKQNQKKPDQAQREKERAKGAQQHKQQKPAMSQAEARRLLQAVAQQERDARRKAARQMRIPGEYPVEKDW